MMWFSGGQRRLRVFVSILDFVTMVLIVEAGNLQRPFNNSITAVFVFGDSTVDPGNNNFRLTPLKSNFPPYGRNFPYHIPTGRFTDGRLVTDFVAAYVGIKEYVPPYLKPMLSIEELMSGVSFASAGSGFDPLTPLLLNVISIDQQLEYFREYKMRLEVAIGKESAKSLLSKASFLISAGTDDVVITYNISRFRQQTFDVDSYVQFLLHKAQQFIQALLKEGAGVIAVVGMPPLGCLPIVITLTSGDEAIGRRPCCDSLTSIASSYNQKIQNIVANMQNSGAIIVYIDIFEPLNDLIHNPSQFGMDVVNAGCCGSGLLEASFLCNENSVICENPSKYVFFDALHPSEATYYYIFQTLRPLIDTVLQKFSHLQQTTS